MKLFCALLIVFALSGCTKSPSRHLGDARTAIADADYAEALSAASSGLAEAPDEKTTWGLELVVLEAHARAGEGEAAVAQLQKLTDLHPQRMPATQYSATASQLKSAGDGPSSIQALDMGMRRFPADDTLYQMIAASKKAADVDNAEFQMLKSLGYVE